MILREPLRKSQGNSRVTGEKHRKAVHSKTRRETNRGRKRERERELCVAQRRRHVHRLVFIVFMLLRIFRLPLQM